MGRFFYRIWKTIDVAGRFLVGIIAIILFVFLVRGCVSGPELPKVDKGSALMLAPTGIIVEQETWVDPIEQAIQDVQGTSQAETSIYDLIDAVEYAKEDDSISVLVINTDYLQGVYAGISKYQDLRKALADFKTSGKKIIAIGDYYMQGQYYLASMADEVYMNPMGMLMFDGMGRNRTYYKSALDKLGVNVHVFRVGTFKSAVEPYLRDNMSDAAKEANIEWLGDLWGQMKGEIAASRNMNEAKFDAYIDDLLPKFEAAGGDAGKLAVDEGFVDKLLTRAEFRQYMIDLVGMNEKKDSYKSIGFKTYLKAKRPLVDFPSAKSQVAVIVAKGEIVDGSRKEGTIGGDSTARLIRKARTDDNVKAIVLRVDSPGGSAFASEVIRSELERAQQEGKVVVASMGGVAASGGYWISATSDEIWAHPSTITGSIGIFGMVPTFEKPLNELGIYRDGVGTTKWSRAFDVGAGISDEFARLIQVNIENGYDDFLSLVARGRDMTKEDVDKIAQGRVWSGEDAYRLGLVDKLGDLDDAIKSAAKLANIEDYDVTFVKRELDPQEVFIKQLLDNVSTKAGVENVIESYGKSNNPIVNGLMGKAQEIMSMLNNFNDPNHTYAHCLCDIK
ncbi:MAG: signal peptide peptidase SppA [Kangiellaceae bacterium]|nr:signal peptide peptidase SppA [Kangiellaceae bacterium]